MEDGDALVSESRLVNLQRGPIHVAIHRVESEGTVYGYLMLVHDMSFVQRRSDDTKKYIFYLFAAIGAIVSLITVVIAEISWRGWVAGLKAVIRGEAFGRGETKVHLRELRPVARDLQALIRDLESERRARDESQINWSAETLRGILRNDLKGEEVLIVSNREPYIHMRRNERIEVQRPASGLVTALEPVMGRVRERGSRTAAATRTAKRRIQPTTSWCRPSGPPTGSGASGSPRRRKPVITTGSRTAACGPCATSRTRARSSALRTGTPTSPSTAGSPTRWCAKRRPPTPSSWSRTITSRCCPA